MGDHGTCGVLLAAGAGCRAGGPKALRLDPDGTSWLLRSVAVLLDGGCETVVVVLGCAAGAAREVVAGSPYGKDPRVTVVEVTDWQSGMSASLRAGLLTAARTGAGAALVHLVDLPDVAAAVVRRVLEEGAGDGSAALARATFGGRPGHPVLIGTGHLGAVLAGLTADRGAGEYLARYGAEGIECGDLATGRDHDR